MLSHTLEGSLFLGMLVYKFLGLGIDLGPTLIFRIISLLSPLHRTFAPRPRWWILRHNFYLK